MGLGEASVHRHVDHYRFYKNPSNVLHVAERFDGSIGRTQIGHMEKYAIVLLDAVCVARNILIQISILQKF